MKHMERKKRCVMNHHGFTLVEVMAAFVILLLASQLLISGTAVARRMEKRAGEISAAGDVIHEKLEHPSECVAGTLRLEIEGEDDLIGDGWMYKYEDKRNKKFTIRAVRLDDSVLMSEMEESE